MAQDGEYLYQLTPTWVPITSNFTTVLPMVPTIRAILMDNSTKEVAVFDKEITLKTFEEIGYNLTDKINSLMG